MNDLSDGEVQVAAVGASERWTTVSGSIPSVFYMPAVGRDNFFYHDAVFTN